MARYYKDPNQGDYTGEHHNWNAAGLAVGRIPGMLRDVPVRSLFSHKADEVKILWKRVPDP